MAQLEHKLNPPQINNTLPAFISGGTLTVPFNLNRSVGRNEFKRIAIIIRTVQTNVEKYTGFTESMPFNPKTRMYEAKFTLDTFTPEVGQYYKVQIAFESNNNIIGYYSTVGVIKCTSKPSVYIKDRENTLSHTYEYVGVYSQKDGDVTEKIYSYRFDLYDESNNLIASSGEQIHNSSKDEFPYESQDSWIVRQELEPNCVYILEYSVTTINGYHCSNSCEIMDAETVEPIIHAQLSAEPSFSDGYIKLSLIGDQSNTYVSGLFMLVRSSSEDDFESWYELTRFQLNRWDAHEIKNICKDYCIRQGCSYKYAIQAYNAAGLYSNRVINREGIVKCDFEDMFLYDGERQLKIRFNPKVSTFKSTILESKMDTIGGKYPFIFRNGNVEYKEFQLSGLLSLLGDENDEFLSGLPRVGENGRRTSPAAAGYVPDAGTWLTTDNYRKEREFKMAVLAWLTNGKPKLFRSPAEGNFIVRLMNTSLSPNDQLGRMLHTFSCSACEIAEYNYENCQDYGFTVAKYTETRNMVINQISLNEPPAEMIGENNRLIIPYACFASITADPDVDFTYLLADNASIQQGSTNRTGVFTFPEVVLAESPLVQLALQSDRWGEDAYLTYGYYNDTVEEFSNVHDIDISDQIIQQSGLGIDINIIDLLEDIRTKAGAFHFIRVKPKVLQPIYYQDGDYWIDPTMKIEIWNSTCLYPITIIDEDGNRMEVLIDGNNPPVLNERGKYDILPWDSPYYINPLTEPYFYGFLLNEEFNALEAGRGNQMIIDFAGNDRTDGKYNALTNIGRVNYLQAGRALTMDIVYQEKIITYTAELNNTTIQGYKSSWEYWCNRYDTLVANNADESLIKQAITEKQKYYDLYLFALTEVIKKTEGEYNIEYAM